MASGQGCGLEPDFAPPPSTCLDDMAGDMSSATETDQKDANAQHLTSETESKGTMVALINTFLIHKRGKNVTVSRMF